MSYIVKVLKGSAVSLVGALSSNSVLQGLATVSPFSSVGCDDCEAPETGNKIIRKVVPRSQRCAQIPRKPSKL